MSDENGHSCSAEGCGNPAMGSRNLGYKTTDGGVGLSVDHLYDKDAEPCPGCGGRCAMAGYIGLSLEFDDEEAGAAEAGVLMSAEEALWLINRLQRGVDVVLAMTEDAPDVEREAIRLGATPLAPPA